MKKRDIVGLIVGMGSLMSLLASDARGVPGPDTVAVIANANIAESVGLAQYYADKRQIPDKQVCELNLPIPTYDPGTNPSGQWFSGYPASADNVSLDDYLAEVRPELESCLGPEVLGRLEAIVVMRGVPHYVGFDVGQSSPHFPSFTAVLGAWDSTTSEDDSILGLPTGETPSGGATWANPFYRWEGVFDAEWRNDGVGHAGVDFTAQPLLVTMLHGLSYGVDGSGNVVTGAVAPARGLVDSAIAAEQDPQLLEGQFLFFEGDPGRTSFDSEYPGVVSDLQSRGFTDTGDTDIVSWSQNVAQHPTGRHLAGFFLGAGDLLSNDGEDTVIEGNTYAPGSIVDNFTSFGGGVVKFDPYCPDNPKNDCSGTAEQCGCYATKPQPSIARWVNAGVAGVHGTVGEPTNNAPFPSRRVILDYVDGATLAEAYFRNMSVMYFKSLVLGDPMAAPYAKRPALSLQNVSENEEISGTRQITASATDTASPSRDISSMRVILDGVEVARGIGSSLQACIGADADDTQLLTVAQVGAAGEGLGPGKFREKGWKSIEVDQGTGSATAPCPPYIRRVSIDGDEATVEWNAPASGGSAITGYTITASDSGGSLNAGASASSVTFTGLDPAITYTFTAKATNAVGTSASSAAVGAPSPPRNVRAEPKDGGAVVTWEAPAQAGGGLVTLYTVTRSPGNISKSVSGYAGDPSAVFTGLDNFTQYTFTVAALNWYGWSAPATSGVVVPGETCSELADRLCEPGLFYCPNEVGDFTCQEPLLCDRRWDVNGDGYANQLDLDVIGGSGCSSLGKTAVFNTGLRIVNDIWVDENQQVWSCSQEILTCSNEFAYFFPSYWEGCHPEMDVNGDGATGTGDLAHVQLVASYLEDPITEDPLPIIEESPSCAAGEVVCPDESGELACRQLTDCDVRTDVDRNGFVDQDDVDLILGYMQSSPAPNPCPPPNSPGPTPIFNTGYEVVNDFCTCATGLVTCPDGNGCYDRQAWADCKTTIDVNRDGFAGSSDSVFMYGGSNGNNQEAFNSGLHVTDSDSLTCDTGEVTCPNQFGDFDCLPLEDCHLEFDLNGDGYVNDAPGGDLAVLQSSPYHNTGVGILIDTSNCADTGVNPGFAKCCTEGPVVCFTLDPGGYGTWDCDLENIPSTVSCCASGEAICPGSNLAPSCETPSNCDLRIDFDHDGFVGIADEPALRGGLNGFTGMEVFDSQVRVCGPRR